MKRLLFLSLMILAACAPNTGTPTPASFFRATPLPANLSLDSTSEQIKRAMLESALQWNTLQLEGRTTWFADGLPAQSFQERIWLDPLYNRYKVEWSGTLNTQDRFLKFSDGREMYHVNLNSGRVDRLAYPDSARVGQYVPALGDGESHPNPIWAQIGTPLSQLAFPSDYAQNDGIFAVVGTETMAGRETIIVEWRYAENSQPIWKMWLDTQAGLILKLQEFSKDGSGRVEGERIVTMISFNVPIEESMFTMPSDLPVVAQPTQAGSMPVVTGAGAGSTDEAGELYFFLQPRKPGQAIQLVRVSGICVSDPPNCPPMETVKVPFAFNFTIHALSWSVDGRFAAFAYSDQPNGTPTKLWVFDPAASTWTSLIQFPYIDPPYWSTDGGWIAFRTQDGHAGEDVYVIRPDGRDLRQVSGSLPVEGRPYIMDGWFKESIVMRSALPGRGSVYLVRASDGVATPMFDAQITKSTFMAAPDASRLVYDEYDSTSQNHVLRAMEINEANPLTLANFTGGSIYPIIWSPDSQWIAFNYYGNLSASEPKADVYVVGRDGGNLSLVYSGTTIGHMIFSPNGHYLLVEETTSTTGGHLFLVDLATLEKRMLQAPLLSTDYDWYAPSWRP